LVGEKGHPPVTHTLWHMTRNGTSLVTTSWTSTHLTLTLTRCLSLPALPPFALSLSFGTLYPPSLSPHSHYLCCRVGACVLQLPVWIDLCWDWVPHGDGAGKQCKQCTDTALRRLNEELGVGRGRGHGEGADAATVLPCGASCVHNSSKRHPPLHHSAHLNVATPFSSPSHLFPCSTRGLRRWRKQWDWDTRSAEGGPKNMAMSGFMNDSVRLRCEENQKEKDLNRNETHLFYSPKKSDTIFSDAVTLYIQKRRRGGRGCCFAISPQYDVGKM